MRLIRVLGCLALIGGAALAQGEGGAENSEEKEKLPPRQVRFLAVGDLPPFRQEVRNGVRIQLKAVPGTVPPREISVGAPKPDGEEESFGEARLQLGRISAPLKVPGGEGVLTVREGAAQGAAEGAGWLQITRPEEGDFKVILWRDPSVGKWDKARSFVLPENRKAGLVTFLNVAPGPVAIVLGGERIALAPGKPLVKPLPEGKPVEFQVGVADGQGGIKRIARRALAQGRGDRTLILLSRSDGEKPRDPLKITEIREVGER